MRHVLGIAVVALAGTVAVAQQRGYPVPGPLNYLPYYQPQQNPTSVRPPLNPYLNLLNGNNPALNYYYGVRPLLPSVQQPMTQQPTFNPAAPRGFFQPVQPKAEPLLYAEPDDTKKFTLPPPGNPVVFGNSFGSSRAGAAGGGRGGFFAPQASQTTGATPGAKTQPPAAIPKSR